MPKPQPVKVEEKREIYRILNRDQCRDLRIPRKNLNPVGELREGEWRRIRNLADTTDAKREQQEHILRAEERKRLEDDFVERRAEFERVEMEQDIDPLEEQVKRENAQLSRQLQEQVQTENLENDDTVRFFNDSLNAALVRAVRDRQIYKSEQVKILAEQEAFRLDNACQKDANLGFTIGQKMTEHRHNEDLKYGALLKDQMYAREEERMMDKERNAAEGLRAQQYARRLQQEEVEQHIHRLQEQQHVTRSLIAENNQALAGKKEIRMMEQRLDLARAKALKQKMFEEDKQTLETRKLKREKEKELAAALSKQKRATDVKAAEDEKKAQRAVYQSDRDWRQKELSKAMKNARELEELKKIIDYQRNIKLRKDAHELEAERTIFQQTQERLVKEATQAEEESSEHRLKRRKDAEELRKQIAKRERERCNRVQDNWEQGARLRQEMKTHDDKVAAYMKDKMDKAEAASIPHGYMIDVVRHMTWNGYLPKPERSHQTLRNKDQVSQLIRHFS